MKYIANVLLAAAAAISPVSTVAQATSDRRVMVPPSVARRVTPILDAVEEARNGPQPMNEEKGSPLWRASELVGKLFGDRSPTSDEALVALLYYYLGEANGEDQLQEIICRGKRMLPFLREYRSISPEIPQRHYSEKIRLAPETVNGMFEEATDEIKKGHSAIACRSRR
jgi:hypothetical protein